MARYMPPGYKKVRRKVAPTPAVRSQVPQETQNILQKQKELADAVRQQSAGTADPVAAEAAAQKETAKEAKKQASKDKRAAARKATKKAAKKATKKTAKKTAKKAAKKATKKAAKKVAKKVKPIKWDESENVKVLYKRAKAAGLNVRSKDWKSEIIQAIKKHNRKASK